MYDDKKKHNFTTLQNWLNPITQSPRKVKRKKFNLQFCIKLWPWWEDPLSGKCAISMLLNNNVKEWPVCSNLSMVSLISERDYSNFVHMEKIRACGSAWGPRFQLSVIAPGLQPIMLQGCENGHNHMERVSRRGHFLTWFKNLFSIKHLLKV